MLLSTDGAIDDVAVGVVPDAVVDEVGEEGFLSQGVDGPLAVGTHDAGMVVAQFDAGIEGRKEDVAAVGDDAEESVAADELKFLVVVFGGEVFFDEGTGQRVGGEVVQGVVGIDDEPDLHLPLVGSEGDGEQVWIGVVFAVVVAAVVFEGVDKEEVGVEAGEVGGNVPGDAEVGVVALMEEVGVLGKRDDVVGAG